MLWHILSPEYPPGCGGVGDYTSLVATALADEGDIVHVWHPGAPAEPPQAEVRAPRLAIHALPDRFGRASREILDGAFAHAPGTILVQYVPTAFGMRGANVPFCRWLLRARRAGADVRVIVHEPFFYFGIERPWRNALAVTQRAMASIVVRASATLYFSTEAWSRVLAPYGRVADAEVLPVPSTIAIDPPGSIVAEWKARLAQSGALLIGHFGTCGDHIGAELERVLPRIWRLRPEARVVLIGDGSIAFAARVRAIAPDELSMIATGRLSSDDAAAALRACDVLIAPYPDGVTTRRTSVMAALSTGRPLVTSDGALTERVWRETDAVSLVPCGDPDAFAARVAQIADDAALKVSIGMRCRQLYDERFALRHTIAALRGVAATVATT